MAIRRLQPAAFALPCRRFTNPITQMCRFRLQSFLRRALAALTAVVLLLAAGCQSTSSAGDDSLASVTIANRTLAEINTATLGVFRRNSFTGGQISPGQYRFERAGSAMNRLAYNDLFGEGVAVRVYVSVAQLDAVSTRVSCKAEIVQDPGDPVIEDSYKVRKFQKKPYQDLLNEIQARLK
jgi:hypothetical protein